MLDFCRVLKDCMHSDIFQHVWMDFEDLVYFTGYFMFVIVRNM